MITLFLAVFTALCILAVPVIAAIRRAARGGKLLDGLAELADLNRPQPTDAMVPDGPPCAWCDPRDRCTSPDTCSCGTPCGQEWCTALRRTATGGQR